MAVPVFPVPRRNDVLLAAAVLGISQLEVWWYGAAGGSLAAALTLGLAASALVLLRTSPVATVALVALGITLCAAYAGEPFSATSVLTFTIGFFGVGAMPQRRISLVTLVIMLGLAGFAVEPFTLNNYLAAALSSVGVPWLLGYLWLRHRSARLEEQRRREAAEEAVAAERLRLAQELHDVVSHNVGMIAVQAGAADVLLDRDPGRSRDSLHAIEDGARATLLELRRMLGLLRDDAPEPRNPRTSLAELPRLIEPVRRAGVEVALEESGHRPTMSSDVEATAYRVIQEALTNVVAHAGQCRVRVFLRYSADQLDVEVTDDGAPQAGSARGGYGITGIRERVGALGGSVTAGPCPGGGFTVRALLPLAVR